MAWLISLDQASTQICNACMRKVVVTWTSGQSIQDRLQHQQTAPKHCKLPTSCLFRDTVDQGGEE